MITISHIAKEKVLETMLNENLSPEDNYLRVSVKGGGCSGLSYNMEFDSKIGEDDEIFDYGEIKILCNKKSLLYLWGTELTYSGGLNGKGFEWVNPNATRTCSCGDSFAI